MVAGYGELSIAVFDFAFYVPVRLAQVTTNGERLPEAPSLSLLPSGWFCWVGARPIALASSNRFNLRHQARATLHAFDDASWSCDGLCFFSYKEGHKDVQAFLRERAPRDGEQAVEEKAC
jgi:hypothetical protein